jgi:hypothetical protein
MYENNEELSDVRSEKASNQPGPEPQPQPIQPQPVQPQLIQPVQPEPVPPFHPGLAHSIHSEPTLPTPTLPEQTQPAPGISEQGPSKTVQSTADAPVPFKPVPFEQTPIEQVPFEQAPVQKLAPGYQWDKHDSKAKGHHHLLKSLHYSVVTSEQVIQVLLSSATLHQRRKQVQLLYECTDVCGTTFRCVLRNSPFSGKMARMCARVCRAYYRECAHYTDAESRMAAKVLLKCANECRKFSEVHRNLKSKNN